MKYKLHKSHMVATIACCLSLAVGQFSTTTHAQEEPSNVETDLQIKPVPSDAQIVEEITAAIQSEPADEPADEPAAEIAPEMAVEIVPEKTLDLCRDEVDNDGDGHIDCGDQDCEIYAICVTRDDLPPVDDAKEDKEKEKSEPEIRRRPFSLGIVPGLNTDMGVRSETLNHFSMNFIGWGWYLKGAEMSAIGGIRRRDVTGFQGAGIFNYTHGNFKGLQGSGISSVTGGNFKGAQFGGIATYTQGSFKGAQGAGIIAINAGDFKGIQGSGIVSANVGSVTGFQGAGIANYARAVKGAQISGIVNVAAENVTGVQVGLVNYGARVRGAQIGLVNIASKEMKGAPIGLVNYAGDGILAPTLWGSDNSMLNIGLKMGSRHVYGILGYGIHPIGDEPRDSLIAGIGGHIDFDPVWLEIDTVSHWLNDDYDWTHSDIDSIHKLRATVGFRIFDQMSLFLGPTLNVMVSEVRDDVALIPTLADYSYDDYNIKLSLGFIGGLQWEPKWGNLNTR